MTDIVDPLVGLEVGRYRVARLVGQGGMGTVYEGVQAESGAAVAIKVLSERYARDPALLDRFFAEARATTTIAHENIIKVHDLAQLPDGRPYIVMELLAGKTLRELIDESPRELPIGGVVNVVLEVLSALGATHAAGIVHRDIKPDNIFVTAKGRAKVLDFGIAKLTGANAVSRTQTGVVLGTPEYMAPEQITDGTVDVRSDLYSLGVVLFEALTGKRPFAANSDFELMRAHVNTDAPLPSTLRASIPTALDDIVCTAMAKDPRDRFATTNAMATALGHVATEITVEQWRSLVPGGRLMSPKPPSLPPAVPIPNSDARRTINVRQTAVTVADRPRAKPRTKPRSRGPWLLVAGLASASIAGGVIATQVARDGAPVDRVVVPTESGRTPFRPGSGQLPTESGRTPFRPGSETPPVIVASRASEAPPVTKPSRGQRRQAGPRRPARTTVFDDEPPRVDAAHGSATPVEVTKNVEPPTPVEPARTPRVRAPRDDPDLRGGLLSATRTAEAVAKDAELVRISILDDGTFAVASYEFASVKIHNTPEPAGVMRRCIVVVGSHASITHEHCMALGREIRPPRCSLAQVKARLKIGADLDRVEYDYTVWWRVRTVDRKKHVDTMSMKDDC